MFVIEFDVRLVFIVFVGYIGFFFMIEFFVYW